MLSSEKGLVDFTIRVVRTPGGDNLHFPHAWFLRPTARSYRPNTFWMEDLETRCASLRTEIAAAEAQLTKLKRELHEAEGAALRARSQKTAGANATTGSRTKSKWLLHGEEYRRYGRQMIVPQLGLQGKTLLPSTLS
jgi:adenylyltransferase/sulfurtransferase